ncbi:hypothetical protein [Nocardia sp. NBC_01009]|uniref:hypothetical protein n=1 Tax=Nocardia sp. NBC_01009 TaxID=2975996 RepID=UPI00386C7D98|nr:hypothetical protein OHA42_10360 [Nocardia sp. NBC_01009]
MFEDHRALEADHCGRCGPDLPARRVGGSLLTIAEMLGRLAVSEPDAYPRERLQAYVRSIVGLLVGAPVAE